MKSKNNKQQNSNETNKIPINKETKAKANNE